MANILYLDIEAIPSQQPGILDEFAAEVKAPATYKKADSIAAWMAENRQAEAEAAWLKTSFDGGMGQIVCIGWAVNDDAPQHMVVADLSLAQERSMLRDWYGVLHGLHSTSGQRPLIVGHNHIAFDLPFLWKRSIVHSTRPPMWFPRDPKPWGEAAFDTMLQWAGARDRISMDKLCRVLGIAGKGDGPTGADVWPMVQAGRLAEVAAYCCDDVARTRSIYKRLTFAEAA